jgi:phage regulator Rha-like protein
MSEMELREDGLYLNKRKIAQVFGKQHIHISLKYLKEAGFEGTVEVSEKFFSEKLFRAVVKQDTPDSLCSTGSMEEKKQ